MLLISQNWLSLVVDASVKSLLLMVLAACLLRVFRVRDTNLRHRVWMTVMIGMLLMPAVVRLTPSLPISMWMPSAVAAQVELLTHDSQGRQLGAHDKDRRLGAAGLQAVILSNDGRVFDSDDRLFADDSSGAKQLERYGRSAIGIPHAAVSSTEGDSLESTDKALRSAPNAVGTQLADAPESTRAAEGASYLLTLVFLVYLIVAGGFMARIALGFVLTRRLVQTGQPIRVPGTQLATAATPVKFLASEHASVPLTVGCRRPVVILPGEWCDWQPEKLKAVLAHELAHVRRADWLVLVLAEFNRALYWFHPVAWSLRRRLSELAELNCDDAVLEANGDATEYATFLLEVAMSLSTRRGRVRRSLPITGVAMARKPNVETRIDAILDEGRPLAMRIGRLGLAALLALSVPAILLAAALSPDAQRASQVDAQEVDAPTDEVQAKTESRVSGSSEQREGESRGNATDAEDIELERFVYAGQVLAPDGTPAVGAQLRMAYRSLSVPRNADAPVATTDENGRFRFELQRDDFPAKADVPPWYLASILVVADGHGVTWAHSMAFEQSNRLRETLQADAEMAQTVARNFHSLSKKQFSEMLDQYEGVVRLCTAQPIQGRLVDTEGRPIQNANVSVDYLRTGWDFGLDKWLASTKESHAHFLTLDETVANVAFIEPIRSFVPDRKTDANGSFTIESVGAEQIARITVRAPRCVTTTFEVQTHDSKPINIEYSLRKNKQSWFGHTFVHVIAPSSPVEGVVRNKATGKPIAGLRVESIPFSGGGNEPDSGSHQVHTTTDAQGRYELTGLPRAPKTLIGFVPKEKPFLAASIEIDLSRPIGDSSITADIELIPGVRIEGRVVLDSDMLDRSQRVAGQIEYMVSTNHPRFQDLVALKAYSAGGADVKRDGSFQLVVPHGIGYLAFRAWDDRIEKTTPLPADAANVTGFVTFGAVGGPKYSAVKKLDLADELSTHRVVMKVKPASVLVGTVVDQFGQSVTEAVYSGRTDLDQIWNATDDDTFFVVGLTAGTPRRVTVVQHARKLAGTVVVDGDSDPTQANRRPTAQLQPWASIRARVVDENGDPISGFSVVSGGIHQMMGGDGGSRLPLPPSNGTRGTVVSTDDEGRFRLKGLVPGVEYSFGGFTQTASSQVTGDLLFADGSRAVTLLAGDDKDVGDLRLVSVDLKILAQERAKKKLQEEASERNDDSSKKPEEAKAAVKTTLSPPFSAGAFSTGDFRPAAKSQGFRYTGKVVDHNGKPVAAAEIHLVYWYSDQSSTLDARPLTHTDARGRFEFQMSKSDFRRTGDSVAPWCWASLVAKKNGHGMAWDTSVAFEITGNARNQVLSTIKARGQSPKPFQEQLAETDRVLALPQDDVPIRGKVVTLEGEPITGARIRLSHVYTGRDGRLDEWLTVANKAGADFASSRRVLTKNLYGPFVPTLVSVTATNTDGEFTVAGLGRDRLVELIVEADGYATLPILCRTRAGETITLKGMLLADKRVFGSDVTTVMPLSRPVTGIVSDAVTGLPLEGIRVHSEDVAISDASRNLISAGSRHVVDVTDGNGRYTLDGLPKAYGNPIRAQPNSDVGYLPASKRADTSGAGVQPLNVNIALQPGITIIGRVVDGDDNRGVSGQLAFRTSGSLRNAPMLPMTGPRPGGRSDQDGNFRIVVPRKEGYLTFTSFDNTYRRASLPSTPKVDTRVPGEKSTSDSNEWVVASPGSMHAIAKVDSESNAKTQTINLTVYRDLIYKGTVTDSDGNRLTDVEYSGRGPHSRWQPADNGQFSVTAYDSRTPRQLAFVQRKQQLAGRLLLSGPLDQQKTLRVQLGPWATIRGRAVDENGDGVPNLKIYSGRLMIASDPRLRDAATLPVPFPPSPDDGQSIVTDEDGRFTIQGVVPGVSYDLSGQARNVFQRGGDLARAVVAKPLEVVDLGDVLLRRIEPAELIQNAAAARKRLEESPK